MQEQRRHQTKWKEYEHASLSENTHSSVAAMTTSVGEFFSICFLLHIMTCRFIHVTGRCILEKMRGTPHTHFLEQHTHLWRRDFSWLLCLLLSHACHSLLCQRSESALFFFRTFEGSSRRLYFAFLSKWLLFWPCSWGRTKQNRFFRKALLGLKTPYTEWLLDWVLVYLYLSVVFLCVFLLVSSFSSISPVEFDRLTSRLVLFGRCSSGISDTLLDR